MRASHAVDNLPSIARNGGGSQYSVAGSHVPSAARGQHYYPRQLGQYYQAQAGGHHGGGHRAAPSQAPSYAVRASYQGEVPSWR